MKVQDKEFKVVGLVKSVPDIGGAFIFGDFALAGKKTLDTLNLKTLGSFLNYEYKAKFNKSIGTAASIGFLISIFGTIGFLTTGIMMQKNVPLSTGFINIPAFLIFIPITIIMAKIGATAVHKIKRDLIAKLFGFFLIIIASRFLYEYFNF